jgi:hypothetical protein
MNSINEQVNVFLNKVISKKLSYVLYVLLALSFLLPILLASVDYIDDTSRKLEGSYQWGGLGRILTEALMHVVTFSAGDMVDVGNLPQILSIPVLAFAGYLVALILAKKNTIKVSDWLIGSLVVVNPLLLPNLSFRFDSLSMVLGYTLSILAGYLFLRTDKYKRYILSIVLLLLAITLYQVTVMMFAIIVIIGFAVQYIDFKEGQKKYIFPVLIKAAITLAGAFVLYYGLVKIIGFKFLVGQRSELVSLSKDGLRQIRDHYLSLINVLSEYIKNTEGLFILVIFITLGIISMCVVVYKKVKSTNKLDTVLFILIPIILFVAILGPLVFMQSAITLQVRVMMAAIGLPLFILVIAHALPRLGFKFGGIGLMVISVIFLAYVMNMSFVYGSALKQQREFDKTVYQNLVNTIMADPELYESDALFLGGEATSPVAVQNLIEKRPILNRLDIAGDNTRWYIFNNLRDQGVANVVDQYSTSGETHNLRVNACKTSFTPTPYVKTEYYAIYKGNTNEFLIWLTNPFTNQNLICNLS